MSDENKTRPGVIKLYGMGGAGINLVKHFLSSNGKSEPGHAIPQLIFGDTSHSNFTPDIPRESCFTPKSTDGSGKVRSQNYDPIVETVGQIVEQVPPGDLNVVVFSGSGGSGSVLGPVLIGELLSRGASTVGIVIGSDESLIAASNTLKTLKSLEGVAAATQQPVVIFYDQNSAQTKRSSIDQTAFHVISTLSILASRQNAELDTMDVQNWVQYNRVTAMPPRLSFLDVYHSNEEADEQTQTISALSLLENPDAPTISLSPDYHAAGYFPKLAADSPKIYHYLISFANVPRFVSQLQERVVALENQRDSRAVHESIVNKRDAVNERGLVL